MISFQSLESWNSTGSCSEASSREGHGDTVDSEMPGRKLCVLHLLDVRLGVLGSQTSPLMPAGLVHPSETGSPARGPVCQLSVHSLLRELCHLRAKPFLSETHAASMLHSREL